MNTVPAHATAQEQRAHGPRPADGRQGPADGTVADAATDPVGAADVPGSDPADATGVAVEGSSGRDTVGSDVTEPGGLRHLAHRMLHTPGVVVSVLFLLLLVAWTLLPDVFARVDPIAQAGDSLAPPSADHWFGTDLNGRDVYSRVVHGTRTSLLAGVMAVLISLVIGGLLGMIAGYLGGVVDTVISRGVEIVVAIPGLLLSLAIVSILGFGVEKVAIAVGIAGIPGTVRVARSETLRIIGLPYMDAARTSGTRGLVSVITHVVPNASGAIAVMAGLDLGGAILSVAALSFLGFGAVPPSPEWGSQINEGRLYIATAWWWSLFPALVAGATVLAVNRLSRGIGTRNA
jgi:peptide/nickel transport system permease protein